MKKDSRKSLFLFVLVGLFTLQTSLQAQQKELKVLFVGNSYTYGNNLPHIVSILSEGTSTKLITKKSVIGGAHLWEHWNGDRDLKTREIIRDGDFDIVVLQDHSMSAIETPDSTLKYVRLFAEYIDQSGGRTYLYNTWARKKVPQFQPVIDEVYTRAAFDEKIIRVPVGSAWDRAMDIRPSIELYTNDGSHPNALATFLTACMFVRAITGELPQDIPQSFRTLDMDGETIYLFNIDSLDAEFCSRVSAEIIP
jgi:hypothetical protein